MVKPRPAQNDRLPASGLTVSSDVGVGPVREAFANGVTGRFVQNRTQSRKNNEISRFYKRPFPQGTLRASKVPRPLVIKARLSLHSRSMHYVEPRRVLQSIRLNPRSSSTFGAFAGIRRSFHECFVVDPFSGSGGVSSAFVNWSRRSHPYRIAMFCSGPGQRVRTILTSCSP
jgi:hypothetical protein